MSFQTTDSFCTNINPFVHRIKLTKSDKLQIVFMSILVAPLRLLGIFFSLALMWIVSTIALLGIRDDKVPLDGWRRNCSQLLLALTRLTLFSCGYHKIIVNGLEHRKEVPFIIAAPHTSYLDAIVIFGIGDIPTCVTRMENKFIPFLGTIVRFMQPIYVSRDDATSRHTTIEKIKDRVNYNNESRVGAPHWPSIMICPEGTCSNGLALLKFKQGAFIPGVPVQPITMKHINKMNTTSWTYVGPNAYKVLWYTLCQTSTIAEVNIMPIYNPSEIEQRDPSLFAHNVSVLMAKKIGIPFTEYSFEDSYLVSYASRMGHQNLLFLINIQRYFRRLGCKLENFQVEEMALSKMSKSLNDFASLLAVQHIGPDLKELYNLFVDEATQEFRMQYFLGNLLLLKKPKPAEEFSRSIFNIYSNANNLLSRSQFTLLLEDVLQLKANVVQKYLELVAPEMCLDEGLTYDVFKETLGRNEILGRLFKSSGDLLKLLPVTDSISDLTVFQNDVIKEDVGPKAADERVGERGDNLKSS